MREKARSFIGRIRSEVRVYRLLMTDARTPRLSKILLAVALAYALTPLDLVPNFIPIVGYVDDVIVITALVFLAVKMSPKEVVEDCRVRAGMR